MSIHECDYPATLDAYSSIHYPAKVIFMLKCDSPATLNAYSSILYPTKVIAINEWDNKRVE
jgi:hypothetical protein